MDDVLDQARDVFEGQIDFVGQRRSGDYSTLLLILTAVVAFNVGLITSDIAKTLYVGLGGTALTFVICVPSWPFYNTSPVEWLPAGAAFEQR